MSNTNQCNCSTTYTRTYNRALSDSECSSRCKAAGYDKGVSNGVTGTWSGTGSTCGAADSAATSNFNNNSSYSTYCDCSNNPEPVKTWSASASRYSIGTTTVTANITYNNPCGTTKSITWSIRSDQGSTTYTDSKTDTVPTGSGSFRSTITTSVAIAANVTVSGSAGGNC